MLKKNAGFTLIEIMLVAAISGLLIVIAIAGQHQLQAQARFDSAIDKTLQNIAYARSYALSNVNTPGGGNDTGSVIAGVGFEFDMDHISHVPSYPLEEIETVYSAPDATGNPDMSKLSDCPNNLKSPSPPFNCSCPAVQHPDDNDECLELFQDLPDDLTLTSSKHASIYYVRSSQGLTVCQDVGSGPWVPIYTACGTHNHNTITVTLKDSSGFSAQIQIDGTTGYAKRL